MLVEEAGSAEVRLAYAEEAAGLRAVTITYVEATSALARMRAGRRITGEELPRLVSGLDEIWRRVHVHAVDDAIIDRAARNSLEHGLRAYDAIQLAGAQQFGHGEKVRFACWDEELRRVADRSGFELLPPA